MRIWCHVSILTLFISFTSLHVKNIQSCNYVSWLICMVWERSTRHRHHTIKKFTAFGLTCKIKIKPIYDKKIGSIQQFCHVTRYIIHYYAPEVRLKLVLHHLEFSLFEKESHTRHFTAPEGIKVKTLFTNQHLI